MTNNIESSYKTITIVISIAAFVMPAITALLNNIHQLIMRKLDLKNEKFNRTEAHRRSVFEEYIRIVGQYAGEKYTSVETARKYMNAYYAALLYAPPNAQKTMQEIDTLIRAKGNKIEVTKKVSLLITQYQECLTE